MRIPKDVFVVLFVLASTALAVRGQGPGNFSTGDKALANSEWRLVSFGKIGAETNVAEGTSVTLNFGGDGRVSGSTGCNNYGGTYLLKGNTMSFDRMISTRRACVDERANQQEQRYLSALESATRFRLSGNNLTIFFDNGKSELSFVGGSAQSPADQGSEPVNTPVALLTSYYAAINAKEYRKAYALWENPATDFEQFARGFANTEQVRILVDPTRPIEGAAGSLYAEIPTIIVARQRGGSERVFGGCYVLRKSNVAPSGWHISKANLTPAPSGQGVSRLLNQTCGN